MERDFGSIRGASKMELEASFIVPLDSGRRPTDESCAYPYCRQQESPFRFNADMLTSV